MTIYPAIDLLGGKCVRLLQGRFDDVTVYNDDPVEQAKIWEASGAKWIHVVDLDGAKHAGGDHVNHEAIRRIMASVNVPVQVGGGIRSMDRIEQLMGIGCARVIIGTAAVKDKPFLNEAAKAYGERLAVGIDAKNGKVALSGWNEDSGVSTLELCNEIEGIGIRTVIFTDISRDGTMKGPSIASTKELVDCTGLDIIASGGVSCYEDIDALREIHVKGVIVGKALYMGAVDLRRLVC